MLDEITIQQAYCSTSWFTSNKVGCSIRRSIKFDVHNDNTLVMIISNRCLLPVLVSDCLLTHIRLLNVVYVLCVSGVSLTYTSSDLGSQGVLSGKVGTGMCGPDGVLFRPLRFTNGLFLFENWFRYRLRFCKLQFSMNFSFSLPIGCQKVLMHVNLHGKKY